MSVFIASAMLLLVGSAYAILLRKTLAETVFLAVASITLILYCLGLLNFSGCLMYGIVFIAALSLASLIFVIYTAVKRREVFSTARIATGCLLYACLLGFSVFINFGRTYQIWDEFSHWGFIVKHFHTVDALGTFKHPNYTILFPSYMPATSLVQYFFARFSGRFVEFYSFIGMNVIFFSLMMPFIKGLFSRKEWIKALILLVLFLMLPMAFSFDFYNSLYVDVILGMFFGFSLLYYFVYRYEESVYGMLMVALSTFMLTLAKDMGLVLSLGVVAIIAADMLFFRRTQITGYLSRKSGALHKCGNILMLALPLLGLLLVKLSWSNLLARTGITSLWRIPSIENIYNFFAGNLEQYQIETRHHFFTALSQRKIPSLNMSVVTVAAAFAVIIPVTAFCRKTFNVRRMAASAFFLLVGLFGYQLILGLMYAFSFTAYEAVHLASYDRYTASYITGMFFFALSFFIAENQLFAQINLAEMKRIIRDKEIRVIGNILASCTVSAVLFLALLHLSYKGFYDILTNRDKSPESFAPRPTAVAAEKWRTYFEQENPYLITQGENGFSYFKMLYELIPYSKLANLTRDYSVSTKPYYPNDVWTFIVSPQEWEAYVLKNYTLVYVFKSDEILKDTYGQFFPFGVQDDMPYHVQNADGHLRLIPVTQ